jgi:hypothetical protein
MKLIQNKSLMMLVCIAGIALLFGCDKDKTPTTATPEPKKWEQIAGHYKVYDTTGVFLYEMDLIHIYNPANNRDSIRFENFDGEFTFTSAQDSPPPSNNKMNIRITGGDTLYDSNNKRWKLYGPSYLDYNNFKNDTIKLRFNKTNINYYIEDVTPYYACDCKQIAVKQH